MKNIIQLFTLGLLMATMSSCVDAGGYVNTGPGHPRHAPSRSYYSGHHNNGYYGNNHPTHYNSRPAPRSSRVSANVQTRGLPLNSNTRLGLF